SAWAAAAAPAGAAPRASSADAMLQAASRHALKRDRLRPSARGDAAGAMRFFCMDDAPIISRELRMVPANAALETVDLGPPAGSASALSRQLTATPLRAGWALR